MALLIKCDGENDAIVAAFREIAPDLDVRVFPETGDVGTVTDAFVFAPPDALFEQLPNLRAVYSRWTGVGHINLDCVPKDVPVVRMTDPSMQATMVAHVVQQVLALHGRALTYRDQQVARQWKEHEVVAPSARRIGFLGLGALGLPCAEALLSLGFDVAGWSRREKAIDGITCFHGGRGFNALLKRSEIVVSILPLTAETTGILNMQSMAQLPDRASIVNVGRGEHVVEADLVAALDSGHLNAAALDVFSEEPLPPEHPYWSHPKIIMTPHVATTSLSKSAAQFVLDNIHRLESGDPPTNQVDRTAGY